MLTLHLTKNDVMSNNSNDMNIRYDYGWFVAYFFMVRPKHDPTTETVSEVDHGGTTGEPDHIWERCPQG